MTQPLTAADALPSPLATAARRFLLDRQARHWLERIDPLLSLGEIRARVVGIGRETPEVKTFVLEPNARWKGHRAGQHTIVEVAIDGVRHRRPFTIASAPGQGTLALTIKKVPDGLVTGFLHDRLRTGAVVGLSPAQGEFVLPEAGAERPLFVTAGSGITPALAMLGELAQAGRLRDATLVHHAKSDADVIALERLTEWAGQGLELFVQTDDGPGPKGFDPAHFAGLVPAFGERETWLCGPAGLMARVEALYDARGAGRQLHQERFVARPVVVRGGRSVQVTLRRSGRTVELDGQGSLLEQLERAGEKPAHGCRMGICQTCRCPKVSGVTRDRETGALSTDPQPIRLCVSDARSDLELDL